MKNNRSFIPCLISMLLFSCYAYAQSPAIKWQKSFGGPGQDWQTRTAPTQDGGVVIAGAVNSVNGNYGDFGTGEHREHDFGIVKLDVQKNVEWTKRYGGSKSDYPRDIKQTLDGGFIVVGYSSSEDGDIKNNYSEGTFAWILKLDSNGDTLWTRCYGGSNTDVAYAVEQTRDGGFIVVGYSNSEDGDVKGLHPGTLTFYGLAYPTNDAWVLRLDSNGDILWSRCIGGSGQEEAFDVKQTSDGGFIITGDASSDDGDFTGSGWHEATDAFIGLARDLFAAKLDANGNVEWTKCYGGIKNETGQSIQQTSDGKYIVVGSNSSIDGDAVNPKGGNANDCWVLKLQEDGSLEWEASFGGTKHDHGNGILQTKDGNYVVLGSTNSNDGDVVGKEGTDVDIWVLGLNDIGEIMWQKTLGGTGGDETLSSIWELSDGGILFGAAATGGRDVIGNKGSSDLWVVELRPCPEKVSISASVCAGDSYDFNGTLLTETGEYVDTLPAVGGCDSVITLTLHHLPAYTVVRDASVCEGEVYDFYGQSVSESGSYIHALKSEAGCDSTISLRFTVNTLPAPEIVAEENSLGTGSYAQYEWLYNDSPTGSSGAVYQAGQTGYYQVAVTDENGCRDTSGSYFVGIPSADAFELEGRYLWKFTIPNLGDQVSAQEYYTERIEYSMTGGVYTNAYTMHLESYDAGEGRWIGVGSGGGSIVKDGVYYVLFFRENRGDSVLVYKHECDSREEAYTFTYPAENATSDYGWNWYVRDAGTGLYNLNGTGVVHLYPNPVRSLLEVQHPFSGTVLMRLLDTYGRLVQESEGAGPAQFDMSACSSGVYLLQVYENNVLRYTERILKQ